MSKIPTFCIGLPVYNEAAVIERSIREISDFISSVNTRAAIIAVDDGSVDESYAIISKLAENMDNLIVFKHETNMGYGEANRSICRLAKANLFEYAIVMDADGTQNPEYIRSFFQQMIAGVDFIKATRYNLGGTVDGVPWQRYVLSRFGNLLAKHVMGIPISDYSNGFRSIKVNKWSLIDTRERGFEVLIEECYLAKKLECSFGEVPYTLTVRTEIGSVSKFEYKWSIYANYLKYVFKK